MHDINVILADHPGLGRVRLCECNSVHVSLGPVTLNLEPAAFDQMVKLINNAATQFAVIREYQDDEPGVIPIRRPIQSGMH